jgi:integrative and conjugative element protein (TIGR02256 family)
VSCLRAGDVILTWATGRLALLPDDIVSTVRSYATGPEAEREAGGILIGSYRGAHIEVTGCTTPLPGDVRLRCSFDRKDPGHHRAAMAAWMKNNGMETFVGEWHTHPEPFPTPSAIDLTTWRSILSKTTFPVLFVIGGSKSLWKGVGHKGKISRAHEATDPQR